MVLLRAAMAAALAAPAYAQLYKEVIQIADGKVQGFQALNNTTPSNLLNYKDITVWKGIPYAADTGGQNRWKPPQKVTPWNDTFQANAFGYQCPDGESTDVNEDCLTVNIWSPATSADEKLPVAVWNYGAGGTSSGDQWDGSGVADKGIVFVNFNYRVSAFGFLALPELNAESPHNVSGNYGLLDQIEVIRWIKNNIAALVSPDRHISRNILLTALPAFQVRWRPRTHHSAWSIIRQWHAPSRHQQSTCKGPGCCRRNRREW